MKTFLPPPEGFNAEALVRACAPAIGLPLVESDVAEVVHHLSRTAGFAALLARVPGIDTDDAAPVFRASAWSKQ